MVAASSTSSGCLDHLELHLDRFSLVYQQLFFCQQIYRKVWVISSPEFQVVLSILSSIFWKHEMWPVYIL